MLRKILFFVSGFSLGALLVWGIMRTQDEVADVTSRPTETASVVCDSVMVCGTSTVAEVSPVIPRRPSFSLGGLIGKVTVTDEMMLSRNNFAGIVNGERFSYHVGVVNDGTNRRTPYRLCELYPTSKKPLLVVYLHGLDCHGNDNELQVKWNIHPPRELYRYLAHRREHALILCPQMPRGQSWGNNQNCVISIIRELIEKYNVDVNRIYVVGTSAGTSSGVNNLIKDHPSLFAGAIAAAWGITPSVATVKQTPVYCVTGYVEGDRTAHYNMLKANGVDCQYEYHPNWNHGEACGYTCSEIVGNDPHYRCEKDPRLEWLFRHVKR